MYLRNSFGYLWETHWKILTQIFWSQSFWSSWVRETEVQRDLGLEERIPGSCTSHRGEAACPTTSTQPRHSIYAQQIMFGMAKHIFHWIVNLLIHSCTTRKKCVSFSGWNHSEDHLMRIKSWVGTGSFAATGVERRMKGGGYISFTLGKAPLNWSGRKDSKAAWLGEECQGK